jgi:hypothetical protein
MRYDNSMRRGSSTEDLALANKLLSSGVSQTRVKEIFKDRIDDNDFESVVEESRETEHHTNEVAPDIKRLVDEAQPPKDFLDPLYMQLMKGV